MLSNQFPFSETPQFLEEIIFVSCSYCNDQAEYVFPDGSDPSVCCSRHRVEGMIAKVQTKAVLEPSNFETKSGVTQYEESGPKLNSRESEPKKGPRIDISEK